MLTRWDEWCASLNILTLKGRPLIYIYIYVYIYIYIYVRNAKFAIIVPENVIAPVGIVLMKMLAMFASDSSRIHCILMITCYVCCTVNMI